MYKFLCGPKFSFLLVISFKHLMVLILIFRSLIHFCMWCIVGIQFYPFGMWISSYTSYNCWKDYYFLMNGLSTLVKKQLTVNIRLYFWTLNFIPLFCMSILMPVTTLFGLLSLCSKFWIWDVWVLLLCSISRSFCLFWVPCIPHEF